MKQYLNKAPLVHVAVQLRFSKIPELTEPSKLINTEITKKMVDIGFNELIEGKGQSIVINANNNNETTSKNLYRFIFRAAGQRDCVILSDESLTLKTTNYDCFEVFSKRFEEILSVLDPLVLGLKKAVVRHIGFRYTNLVVPEGKTVLDDYFVDGVLPVRNILDKFNNKVGISQAIAETEQNQILRLVIEEVQTQNGKVTKVLPDELLEPEQRASLLINGYAHWSSISASQYAILDLDHIYEFQESPLYDKSLVINKLNGLHEQPSTTFWNMIKQSAKDTWQAVER